MPRNLRFYLTTDAFGDREALNLLTFEWHEGLSTPFAAEIHFYSTQYGLRPEQFIDQSVSLTVERDGEIERHFHGIVKAFTRLDTGFDVTYYRLHLMPEIGRLVYRHNSRIYQQMSTMEIVESLLAEMGIIHYALALRQSYEAREYCVQYDENDWQFIERLLAEEGIYYYFEHGEDQHTLVFSDHTNNAHELPHTPEHEPIGGGLALEPHVFAFNQQIHLAPNEVKLKDYTFKQPSTLRQGSAYSDSGLSKVGDYEHYDFPGRFVKDAIGKAFSEARIHYLRRDAHTGAGKSNASYLSAGYRLTMEDNYRDERIQHPWFITHVVHTGTQPQSLEHHGGEGNTTYHNEFAAIPANLQWKPAPWVLQAMHPKPLVCGPQIAKVTGPSGEEIYTDEFGRVKVQFPWDRYGQGNEKSSCWIRVNQGWAGESYGQVMVPRVGHEVMVDYLEGDPDQPVIVGALYHATHQQPYALPAHKTRSVLRSKTHRGEGYNELTFEDQKGNEFIYTHAQKDMNIEVKNDHKTHVKNEYHLRVDNTLEEKVEGTASYTYEKERHTHIKGNDTQINMGLLAQEIKEKWINSTDGIIDFEAGFQQVLDAGSSITLKSGGSFVRIDPSGIYINGPTVQMLPGGGGGHGGTKSDLPKDPEVIKQIMLTLAPAIGGMGYKGEYYELYRDGALVEKDKTDEEGRVNIRHVPGTKEYKVKLLSGAEFIYNYEDEPKEGIEHILDQIKWMGYRENHTLNNPKEGVVRSWQSDHNQEPTGKKDDVKAD